MQLVECGVVVARASVFQTRPLTARPGSCRCRSASAGSGSSPARARARTPPPAPPVRGRSRRRRGTGYEWFDMFCALNGATRTPRRRSQAQIAVVIQLLPAFDEVPPMKSDRAATRRLSQDPRRVDHWCVFVLESRTRYVRNAPPRRAGRRHRAGSAGSGAPRPRHGRPRRSATGRPERGGGCPPTGVGAFESEASTTRWRTPTLIDVVVRELLTARRGGSAWQRRPAAQRPQRRDGRRIGGDGRLDIGDTASTLVSRSRVPARAAATRPNANTWARPATAPTSRCAIESAARRRGSAGGRPGE